MKPLKLMDNEIQGVRCGKCDYLNNKVAIDDKKPNCAGMDNLLGCEVYMKTLNLQFWIHYLMGESGPMFADYGVLDGCQNVESSYGEVCVQCNKCGRFREPTEEEKQRETEAEIEIERLFDEAFSDD